FTLQFDFRLVRRLVFRDCYSIGLIAEAENLTNRYNANRSVATCAGAVVKVATAPEVGRGADLRPPCRFQFGGRFMFRLRPLRRRPRAREPGSCVGMTLLTRSPAGAIDPLNSILIIGQSMRNAQ